MFTVIVLVKGLIDTGEELSFRNKMFESHAFKVQKKNSFALTSRR